MRIDHKSDDTESQRVFLSYSRKDFDFVRRLADSLSTAGYQPDFDQATYDPDNVATGISAEDEWWQRIQDMIVAADAIVFVVSPDSANSKVCDEEIAFARALNKRILAVLRRPIDFDKAPPRLAALNVKVHFTQDERYEETVEQLCRALKTDVGWIREHTRLGAIAERWERQKRPKELLLRGAELAAAEAWLTRHRANAPEPPETLRAFILEGRRATTARLRALVATSLGVGAAALVLAAYAFWQQRIAVANEERAIAALKDQSVMIADRSREANRGGLQLESLLLAAGVLPDKRAKSQLRREWPYTKEAHLRLIGAMTGTYSRAAFPEPVAGHFGSGANFSPDGKFLIAPSAASGAVVWNLDTGELVRRLFGHAGNVNDAVFSVDGRYVATASTDETVRIWNTRTWEAEHVLEANPSGILKSFSLQRVLISPDNSFVAALLPHFSVEGEIGLRNLILVWPMADGASPRIIDKQPQTIMDLALSPDGKVIALATLEGSIRLVRVSDGALLRSFPHPPESASKGASALDFDQSDASPSRYRLLTAGSDNIRVWHIERLKDGDGGLALGAPEERLKILPGGSPQSAEFSPDGKSIIASTATINTAELWDAETGARKGLLLQYYGATLGRVRMSPDGSSFVTPALSAGPVVWWVNTKSDLRLLYAGQKPVGHFSPDGSLLAVAGRDGSVLLFSGPDFTTRNVLGGHTGKVISLDFDATGRHLVTAGQDGRVISWDLATERPVWNVQQPDHIPGVDDNIGIKISNAGRYVVSNRFARQEMILRDLETGQEVRRFRFYPDTLPNISKSSVLKTQKPMDAYVAFSPDDRLIALADALGALQLWDVETGKLVHRLAGHGQGVNSLAFHASEPLLLTSSNDGFVKLWDTSAGTLQKQLSAGGAEFAQAAFSPDGTEVVGAAGDGTARIWDLATGAFVRELTGHTSGVRSLEFSRDGERLATASNDGTVGIWKYAAGEQLASLQLDGFYNMVGASFSPDGKHVLGTSAYSVVLWPDYRTIEEPLQETIERVQATVTRCMTPSQRKRLILPPEPPRWCITGAGLETEPDTSKWKPKWPFQSDAWREWLVRRDADEAAALPWRFD